MKKIEAVIKPFKLDEVKDALHEAGVSGITVTEAKGFGRQKGIPSFTEAPNMSWISCQGEAGGGGRRRAGRRVVEAIAAAARTGRIGDGKIFVSPIEEALRIRTGERGTDAI